MTMKPALPRRNPREERGHSGNRITRRPLAEDPSSPTSATEPTSWVLAIPDALDAALSSHDEDMLACARILADTVDAGVVVIVPPRVQGLNGRGIDRIATVPVHGNTYANDTRVAFITEVMDELRPRWSVLPDTIHGGGDLGRQLAVVRKAKIATAVKTVKGQQIIRSSANRTREQSVEDADILLVLPESAKAIPHRGPDPRAFSPVFHCPRERVRDFGFLPNDPETTPLAEADLIISAGIGVTNWEDFYALAKTLGAAIGATRPACDAGFVPRSRQVGASGTIVDPRVYLAFGISGSPQHLQGISSCPNVIAVNTDLHAAIIKRANLAIIADAQEVMPALRARAAQRT
ncbi:electron transfer flavoprotein subunit alpha/FixB family protein [Bradyrhizobium sp. BWA-3-5]|uniref:electron transfer flavoprotein subunit alpha/FixB family protein n=1 Tax=Bradyrhizobium sp. BWA-3-5 TaxID=3080013 RepID=UPI00293E297B|nr:electron transfer flavoprotein subunit alpha/FixB family protein [Bradyrhizobium sp. BWA-3-5]WOH63717.1 electron transfer flavoprotein subunit alpha/FixB family protein [Bradyrhizobium sp. BWA-3-5]